MTGRRQLRSFDLFCGGGGSSLGAMAAGVTPAGGADIWPLATESYLKNIPNAHTFTANICDLSPRAVRKQIGSIDLLLASPECTHHSVAKGNKPRCEASKQLAYEVIRFASELKPRWIAVENVIQMRVWPAFEDWLSRLHQLGYQTATIVLDAQRFGVPQTRRRLFVLCDLYDTPTPPRVKTRKEATVRQILTKAHQKEWSFNFTPLNNGRRATKTIERAERAIASLGPDQEFIMVYYGSDGAGGFQSIDRPLRTVTTLDRFALVRPNCVGHEMRMLQPSELALAMGFPVRYRFPEVATRRDCIKLLGNAVCPPVMRSVVQSLIRNA